MTTELVSFDLPGGEQVFVEVEVTPHVSPVSKDGVVAKAVDTLEATMGKVRDAASVALEQFRGMVHKPDELEIKFGVKLDAQAGAVIAKTGVQGHFEVKLTWKKPAEAPPAG